jgi:hypothetical protein
MKMGNNIFHRLLMQGVGPVTVMQPPPAEPGVHRKEVSMKMKKVVVLIFLFLSLGWDTRFIFSKMRIITHPDTHVASLKKKDIRDIFLGRKKSWEKNEKITLATLKEVKAHEQFLKQFVNKTPFQFRNYWREKVFLGESESPKSFETEERLINFVAGTKGAIGYISSPTTRSVKIIPIIEEKEGK